MTYRLISEEDLEKLGLNPEGYSEPIWYFTEEKARNLYASSVSDNISQEELKNFIEYLKAFIKVSPGELKVLDDYMTELIVRVEEMYREK